MTTPTTYASRDSAIACALAEIDVRAGRLGMPEKAVLIATINTIKDHLSRVAPGDAHFTQHMDELRGSSAPMGSLRDLKATPEPAKPAEVGPSWDFDKLKGPMIGEYILTTANGTQALVPWTCIKDILRDALKHGGLKMPSEPSAVEALRELLGAVLSAFECRTLNAANASHARLMNACESATAALKAQGENGLLDYRRSSPGQTHGAGE